jgi:hypothetical protein
MNGGLEDRFLEERAEWDVVRTDLDTRPRD